MNKKWLNTIGCALVLMLSATIFAQAQEKIAVATSANSEVMALFVATEEGFFKKRGLDVEVKIIALNPTIPASLISNSIQIGLPTPTVFDQAVENGLDLVAIAGVSVIPPDHSQVALLIRNDVVINSPADYADKTIAVPGFNAILHVALQVWLEKNGVSPKSVRFVEASIPQMGDLLKSNRVDAAVTVDPFLTRFREQGIGRLGPYFLREVGLGQQTMYYATTREWAAKNGKAISAFREALNEAAEFTKADPDKSREDMNKYMKLPPDAAKVVGMPRTTTTLTADQFNYWVSVMRRIGLMNSDLDYKKFVIP